MLNLKLLMTMVLMALILGSVLLVVKLFKAYRKQAISESEASHGFHADYVHSMANRPMGGGRSPLTWESFSRGQDLMNGLGKSKPELIRNFFEIPVVLTGEYIPADSYGPDFAHDQGFDNGYDGPSSARDNGLHPPGTNPFRSRPS